MMRFLKLGTVAGGLVAIAACDYSGDFLFPEPAEEVPYVYDLGLIEPVPITTFAEAADAAVYGQVSSSGTLEVSGVTYSFEGTGGPVCVFVDPEFVTWNQSVAARGGQRRWSYPDNLRDDGDMDLEVGLAIYYTGSPGERIGNFAIRYEDALGNPVSISLNECVIPSLISSAGGHAGRGAPEYCTVANTQPGVRYVVKMEAWSTPLDDDRLGFGMLLADGTCSQMIRDLGQDRFDRGVATENTISPEDTTEILECLIPGEMIDPELAAGPGPFMGADEAPTVVGAREHEAAFCAGENMADLCAEEATALNCKEERCFCGDPTNTPSGGAF